MNEEKSMVEYKESKGILGWLKSKFEKFKERFSPKTNIEEVKNTDKDEQELFEEDVDKVEGGSPFEAVDIEGLKADLGIAEPKSWELTEEEKAIANSPIEHEEELFEEDLDKITAGHPIIDEDEYSK